MPLAVIDGYLVNVPDEGTDVITALDGTTDSFSPVATLRYDPTVESANEVSELIDGTVAVALVGDRLPSGTITFLFTSDAAMMSARAILARPTSFSLVLPTRPALNMTFVRSSSLTPGMHDQVRKVWEFSVGYQEVQP